MKGEVAASAVALATLARDGWRRAGRSDLHRCRRRGGGQRVRARLALRGRTPTRCAPTTRSTRAPATASSSAASVLYLCATAEKMTSPFELRVHGRSGHAAMPGIADNALVKAAALHRPARGVRARAAADPRDGGLPQRRPRRGACRSRRSRRRTRGRPQGRRAARAAARPDADADDGPRLRPAERHPGALHRRDRLPPAARPVAGRGRADDPRPDRAGRLRAGQHRGARRALARAATAPLWDAVQSFVDSEEPGAKAAPLCVAGFTDSHWLREAFGTTAYGFFPSRTMDTELASRAHPLGRRARAGLGSRARRALAAARGARRLRVTRVAELLELHDPVGAFEAVEAFLAEQLRPGLVADLYLGLRPVADAPPRAGARTARAVRAAARRLPDPLGGGGRPGRARHVPRRGVGADLGAGRLRRRRRARCGRQSRAGTCTRSTSSSICRRRLPATPPRSRRALAPASPARSPRRSSATAGRSSRPRPSSSCARHGTGW